jgi:photosystem II stability/assembly factor-like uncharacterized protein
MKKKIKIIIRFLISLLYTSIVFSQEGWFQQTSGSGYHLQTVFFINENIGWIGGDAMTLLKTTNGGVNWVPLLSGWYPESILDIYFMDQYNGIIVGGSPTNTVLALTSNGGLSWIGRPSGTSSILSDVFFQNDNIGWIVGDWGVLLKTTDGGWNWTSYNSGTNNRLTGIIFTNSDNGIIIGRWGMILRSTDGGANWFSQSSGTGSSFSDISFANENDGLIVGDGGTILKTTDGGVNWTSQVSNTTNFLNGVAYIDADIGTIVGHDGIILRTTNGGSDWYSQTSGVTNPFYEVFFINSMIGTVVGGYGVILRTLDGGVPVELISFKVSVLQNEKAVRLNWKTATETNNSGFEIEKLQDSKIEILKDWETIGFVPGFGTTTEPKSYSFIDENVATGTYKYRLKQIDFDGTFTYSNEIEVAVDLTPKEFVLYQNYPNPFNPSTTISWQSPVSSWQTLKIFDVVGNEVITLVDEYRPAGKYEIEFHPESGIRYQASGIYFYQLKAGNFVDTKKMILLH